MRRTGNDTGRRILEFFEERAAIMEFCGGLPRAEAERRARAEALAYRDRLKKGKEDGEG